MSDREARRWGECDEQHEWCAGVNSRVSIFEAVSAEKHQREYDGVGSSEFAARRATIRSMCDTWIKSVRIAEKYNDPPLLLNVRMLHHSSDEPDVVLYTPQSKGGGRRSVIKPRGGRRACVLPLGKIARTTFDRRRLQSIMSGCGLRWSDDMRRVHEWLHGHELADRLSHVLAAKARTEMCVEVSRHFSMDDIEEMRGAIVFDDRTERGLGDGGRCSGRRSTAQDQHRGGRDELGARVTQRARLYSGLFKEPKSGGETSRLVFNGIRFNELCAEAGVVVPRMDLPRIPVVIATLLHHCDWVAGFDAQSGFYQYSVGRRISEFFGVRVAAQRGNFLTGRYNTLPMGIEVAPVTFHETSKMIVEIARRRAGVPEPAAAAAMGIHQFTYLDNYVFGGTNAAKSSGGRFMDEFIKVCDEINWILKGDVAQQRVQATAAEVLGLRVDLAARRVTHVNNYTVPAGTPDTARSFFQHTGTMIFDSYVFAQPLCFVPYAMRMLGVIGCSGRGWDAPLEQSEELREAWCEMLPLLRRRARNEPRKAPRLDELRWHTTDPQEEPEIWGDATLTTLGGILERRDDERPPESWAARIGGVHVNVYMMELLASAISRELAYDTELRDATLATDNTTALSIFGSALSTSLAANLFMRAWLHESRAWFHGCTVWRRSEEQRADAVSRLEFLNGRE